MNKKNNKLSKTNKISRIMCTILCVVPAAIIGFIAGQGIFGLAFGIFAGFLFTQVLTPLLTLKGRVFAR